MLNCQPFALIILGIRSSLLSDSSHAPNLVCGITSDLVESDQARTSWYTIQATLRLIANMICRHAEDTRPKYPIRLEAKFMNDMTAGNRGE